MFRIIDVLRGNFIGISEACFTISIVRENPDLELRDRYALSQMMVIVCGVL